MRVQRDEDLSNLAAATAQIGMLTVGSINGIPVNMINGSFTIVSSGVYNAGSNVTGTVIVSGNNLTVTLDLQGRVLDANQAANAFLSIGTGNNITITNGTIINTSDTLVSISNASSAKLINLNFDNANLLGRAIWLNACNNVFFDLCNVSNFLSTSNAVVQLDTCTGGTLSNSSLTRCSKILAAPTAAFPLGLFVQQSRLWSMQTCSNIQSSNLQIDANTNSSIQTINTFEALGLALCSDCTFINCTTNSNVDNTGGANSSSIMTGLIACSGITFRNLQTNFNSCSASINVFAGVGSLGNSRCTLYNCNSDFNTVAELSVSLTSPSLLNGYGFANSSNCIMYGCSASNNTVRNPGTRTLLDLIGFMEGIGGDVSCYDCIANNNTITLPGINNEVIGIAPEARGTIIKNCVSNFNTGGTISMGILLNTSVFGTFTDGSNVQIIDCTSSYNGNFGIHIQNPIIPGGSANNLEISGCILNNNGGVVTEAGGIKIASFSPTLTNPIIKNCQITGTNATDVGGIATGINIIGAIGAVIENNNIQNTSGTTAGNGINLGAGSSASLIKNNKLINNTGTGIIHTPVLLTTSIIGNEAQNNGTPYTIGGGTISIQSLSAGTGLFANVIGNSAFGAVNTNLSLIA